MKILEGAHGFSRKRKQSFGRVSVLSINGDISVFKKIPILREERLKRMKGCLESTSR